MDLFITVYDKEADQDIYVNASTIESYIPKTITDIENNSHICILYVIFNGIRLIEEFDTEQDRQDKLDTLDLYFA